MPGELGSARFVLETDISKFKAGIDEAKRASESVVSSISSKLSGIGKAFEETGSKLRGIGTNLTLGVTAPIAGALGITSKFGLEFEDTMTQIASLTNVPQEQIGNLRESIFRLAKEVAKSPQELGAGAYFVLSSGFSDAADAAKVLEVAAKMSAVGMGETEVTARALTQVLMAYGLSADHATEIGDLMNQTVRSGSAEASELANSLSNVVPLAAQLGVGFDVVGAALAEMTNKGFSTAEATTALRQLFTQLISPSKELEDSLAAMGFTLDDILTGLRTDAIGTLTELSKKAVETGQTVTLFGNEVRANSAFLSAFSENVDETRAIVDQMRASQGKLNESFETTAESTSFKVKKAWNDMKISMTEAGVALIPVITDLLNAAKPLFKMLEAGVAIFKKLPGPVRTGLVAFLLAIAAVGPALAVFGTFVNTIGTLISLLPVLGAVLGVLLSPLGLVLLAVVGLGVGAYFLIKNWDDVVAFLKDKVVPFFTETIPNAFRAVLDWVKEHWFEIFSLLLSGPMAPVVALATDAFGIRTALFNAFKWLVDKLPGLLNQLKSFIIDTVKEVLGWLVSNGPDVAKSVVKVLFDAFKKLLSELPGILKRLVGVIKSHWKEILILISGPLAPVMIAVIKAFEELQKHWRKIAKFMIDQAKKVKGWFASKWPEIATILSGPFAPIVALATDAFGIRSALTKAFGRVLDWIKGKWSDVTELLTRPFEPVKRLADKAFGISVSAFEKVIDSIKDIFSDLANSVKKTAGDIGDRIFDGLTSWTSKFSDTVQKAVDKALDIGTFVFNLAKKLGDKITDGVESGLSGFSEMIQSAVEDALDIGKLVFDKAKDLGEKSIDGVKEGLKNLGNVIMFLFKLALDLGQLGFEAAKKIGEKIVEGVIAGLNTLGNVVRFIVTGALNLGSDAFNLARDLGGKVVDGIISGLNDLANVVKFIFAGALNIGSDLFSSAKNLGTRIIDGVIDTLSSLYYVLKYIFTSALDKVKNDVFDVAKKIGKAIYDGILSGLGKLAGWFLDNLSSISGFFKEHMIPGHEQGTAYVPHDTLAFLHRGEMVIPAKPAEIIREGKFIREIRSGPSLNIENISINVSVSDRQSGERIGAEVASGFLRELRLRGYLA